MTLVVHVQHKKKTLVVYVQHHSGERLVVCHSRDKRNAI